MPVVLIEIRRECTAAEETALMDAVHAAIVSALKIPAGDRIVRLQAHPPHRFACPPGKARPDLFTLISIDLFSGRSLEAKRTLYATIAAKLGELGIPADHILVRLRDIPRENWGVRGLPASEIDLGFKVEV
ncbi:tautomerase family protein [Uliginosibacterium sp. 31-12]|uniref:tautomerase family protein n=1 Tax=Uliginosibacterium sp. 31-12 TaxID=3062781 RepID=UPI0026E26A23|nr:tautomerase family protein [Uliginosibacterium sp. 31-12]MDO6385870.1 tautomerase family protein [Uliginosibacterium sp. 31-12]